MKPSSLHAALELGDAVRRRDARRLRQHADRREVLRVERADAVDQVVLHARPVRADRGVADVVLHRARARREERDVGAPLALQLQLGLLQAVADLVVADLRSSDSETFSPDAWRFRQSQRAWGRWCSGRGSRRSSEQLLHREPPWDHLSDGTCTRSPPRGCGGSPPAPNGFISGLPAAFRLRVSSA